jgi:hypothetical protein
MKGRFLIVSLLVYYASIGQSGKLDSILTEYAKDRSYDTLTYTLGKTPNWFRNLKAQTFTNNFSHSTIHSVNHYLALNDDFTFVFLVFYEPGIDMTIGKWKIEKDSLLVLNWNKKKTIEAFKDKKKWKKYATTFSGMPLKISNWIFTSRNNVLIPIKRENELTSSLKHRYPLIYKAILELFTCVSHML